MTQQEFNARIVEHQVVLYGYARSLTKNIDDADDLVQDTLLKALLHKDKYEDDTNLKAWLMTILRNLFINKYRWTRDHGTVLADTSVDSYFLNLVGKSDVSPESLYNEKEIREVIDQIKPRFRDPFIMHFDGYKYEEIAERLDVPLGTIKSRIFFARKSIMDALSGKCALAPALIASKDIMIEDNSLKFVKPMKEEILKFRTICENMIKAGITNKNKITLETSISWPTFKKITEWSIDTVHVEDDTLERIVSFNKKHSTFVQVGMESAKKVFDEMLERDTIQVGIVKRGRGQYERKPKVEKHKFKPIVHELMMDEEKDKIKKEISEEFAKDKILAEEQDRTKKELNITYIPFDFAFDSEGSFWRAIQIAFQNKPDNITLTILTK